MAAAPPVSLDQPNTRPDEERISRSVTGARILLADDDADTRDNVTWLLTEHGWDVDAVANGEAALEAARRDTPDLVLSDVLMAGLDGLELVTILRSDPKLALVPIILISARTDEDSWANGLAAGADDYLGKPFAARELLIRVSAHIAWAFRRTRGIR
jgi:DNA-binding response OmpR family regulator